MKWLIALLFLTAGLAGCTSDDQQTQEVVRFELSPPPIQYGPAPWEPLPCDHGGATHYGLNALPIDAWRVEPMTTLEWFASQVELGLPENIGFEHALHLVTDIGNISYAPEKMEFWGQEDVLGMTFAGNATNFAPLQELLDEAGALPNMDFETSIEVVGNSTTFRMSQTYQNHKVFVAGAAAEVAWTINQMDNTTQFGLSMAPIQRTFYGLTLMDQRDAAELAQAMAECLTFDVPGRPNLNATQLVWQEGLHVVEDSLTYAFAMDYHNGRPCEEGIHYTNIHVDAFTGAILSGSVMKRTC